VLNHTRGGRYGVDPPRWDYDVYFHNHPFGGNVSITKPSGFAGVPSGIDGDMMWFKIHLIKITADHGAGTPLFAGTVYRNERIFIVGKINRNITANSMESEIISTHSEISKAVQKWEDEVDKCLNEFQHVNDNRNRGLSSLSRNEFAEEYQNTMYKSFNHKMKNEGIDIRIYRWVL